MTKYKRIYYETTLTEQEELSQLYKAAQMYNNYADLDILFVYRKNKFSDYKYHETYYGKDNFMHLTGCKGYKINAIEFFEKCLDKIITKKEFTYIRDKNTAHEKLSILPDMLDFKNSKIYKIGDKDLISKNNKFKKATGNSSGIMGYDNRRKIDNYHVPVTVIKKPITDYVTTPQTIIFIFKKKCREVLYNELIYSIKKDLIIEDILSNCIKEKIESQLFK